MLALVFLSLVSAHDGHDVEKKSTITPLGKAKQPDSVATTTPCNTPTPAPAVPSSTLCDTATPVKPTPVPTPTLTPTPCTTALPAELTPTPSGYGGAQSTAAPLAQSSYGAIVSGSESVGFSLAALAAFAFAL